MIPNDKGVNEEIKRTILNFFLENSGENGSPEFSTCVVRWKLGHQTAQYGHEYTH